MKKKILFVTNVMGRAGAERTLLALFEKLDKEKCDISLFAIMPRGEFFANVPDYVKILNKKYSSKSIMGASSTLYKISWVAKSFLKRFYFITHLPHSIKTLYLQIKNKKLSLDKFAWFCLAYNAPRLQQEFDLAIAYIEGASTYYVANHVRAKSKVCYVHIDYERSGYLKQLDKPFYEKFEKIFCVSDLVKQSVVEAYPALAHKIDTYQNTISDEMILKSAEQAGGGFTDDFDGIRLLTVGRLHVQKAYDVAIKAFAGVCAQSDLNIRWYVLGEGAERPKLEKLISKYNLEGKFILLGIKENPFPYMKQCDIYVHATRFEGWCIAIAEAKILKKPIIATNSAGVLEQLSPDSSIIINLSEKEIIDAIIKLASDKSLRERFTEILNEQWKRPNDIGKLYTILDI